MARTMRQAASRVIYRYRRVQIVLLHVVLVLLTNYLAFLLRFRGRLTPDVSPASLDGLPRLVAIAVLAVAPFGLYPGVWRYAGIWAVRNSVGAGTRSSLAFYGWAVGGIGLAEYPATALVVDSLLLIFFTGGVRLRRRIHGGVSRLL